MPSPMDGAGVGGAPARASPAKVGSSGDARGSRLERPISQSKSDVAAVGYEGLSGRPVDIPSRPRCRHLDAPARVDARRPAPHAAPSAVAAAAQAEKSMRPLWLRLLVLWLIPLAGPALARPAGSRPRWSPGVVRALAQALGRGNSSQAPATTMTAAAVPCVPTRADKRLRKVLLTNKTVACNDGSPAGYYIRKWHGSRRWIIFLEGGWHCYDEKSCAGRWMRTRQLMSSAQWHDTRHVGGILSPDPEENQYWWNANHVLIPYCSSDAWSGSTNGKTEAGYAFMGSLIVQEVILELLDRGLYEAKMLLLAGSSAGGAGVLLNVDRVADLLGSLGSRVKVRGVADSGWFLDNEPFEPRECLEPHSCAPLEVIKRGMKLWQGQVPERCKPTYPEDEQWRCYFGYRIYPTLRAPTFVFQWLFDEAQMTVDNVAAPSSKAQWDYIHSMGSKLRSTLSNVTALFAPSCISHMVLTKRNWQSVQICGISLPQALRCWELQRHEHNHHEHHPRHHLYDRLPTRDNETNSPPSMVADMSLPAFPPVTAPHEARSKRRKGKRRRKNCKHRHRRKGSNRNNARRASAAATAAAAAAALADRRGRQSSPRPDSRHVQHRWRLHEDLCKHWLMDSCTWPQCNRHCPRMLNPLTGQEVDFLDLLRSFGLDMAAVALALGVDQKALGAMDHDTLLQLLTQHAV